MRKTMVSKDPDIIGSFPALRRAAKAARRLAERTGTPLYVFEDGKVVNINPMRRHGTKRKSRAKSA